MKPKDILKLPMILYVTIKTVEEFKNLINFYKIKEKFKNEKNNSVIYTSVKSFLNYEKFTPESVENNLLKHLLKENNKLMNEIIKEQK